MENKKADLKFGYTPEEYKIFESYAWRYLLGFAFLYMCMYCCRLNLSSAMPLMIEEEGWSTAQLGLLTAIMFWTYAAGDFVNGRLSDILGTNRLVVLAVILSAAANVIFGFQHSIIIMAVIWGLNGYFQSMAWSPGMSAIMKWWPGERRGFATGLAHASSGVGQAVCIVVVMLSFAVLPGAGWKAAFWLPPVIPLVMLIIYLFVAKTSPTKIGLNEYVEDDPVKKKQEEKMARVKSMYGPFYPYLYLLRNGRFIVWLVIAFIVGIARYGLVTWIPLYFIDKYDVDISTGLMSTLVLPLGMAIGDLVVPWLTDKLCPVNRLPAVIISGLAAAAVVIVFFIIPPGFAAQVLLFFGGFFTYAINGLCWGFAGDIGGRIFAGTATGLLDGAVYIGAGCQSAVFGVILARSGWTSIFTIVAGGLLILVILALIGSTGKRKNKI